MIREFVQSIDDREWQTQLFALLQKQTYNQVEVDLFELMCKVLDQNLFSQVDWARNTVFFKDLKVWTNTPISSHRVNQKSEIRKSANTDSSNMVQSQKPVFKLGAKSAACYVNHRQLKATSTATPAECALNFDFIWRLTYLASKAEPVSQPSSSVSRSMTQLMCSPIPQPIKSGETETETETETVT